MAGWSPLRLTAPSATDAQALDDLLVARLVLVLQVVEERTPQAHHLEQATAGVIVFLVHLEVVGQRVDALGEKRDLHFWRARVALLGGVTD